MIDNVSPIMHFHGYPSIAISPLVLMKYVSDLFLYLAVLVLVIHMLDVVIVRGTRKLCYIQQQ